MRLSEFSSTISASGISGYSGYSGAGTSGWSGYSGVSGWSGYSGISGWSGYSGSGISGWSGYSGAGTSGWSGYSGISGWSGYSGISGWSGYSGFSGRSGYSGTGVRTLNFIIDGGGAAITTGSKGFVTTDIAYTISQWTIISDVSGNCVVDIKRSTYANFPTTASIIGTGNKPTLSSAQKNQATPNSSWTSTSIAADDVLEFNVDSAATVGRVLVSLELTP